MTNWMPYSPSDQTPWSASRVAHLHRRTVFGVTRSELRRDLAGEPQDAVSRILAGEVREYGVPDKFATIADLIGDSAVQQPNVERLKAWWLYRILFTPDPLRERLTLMWHDHFATSNLKVDSLVLMRRQNETLRRHAKGSFGELLHAMLQDPAMLLWLDASTNRKGRVNENLARELMELFTLGIGNYTEPDVKNVARALTGLKVKDGEFGFDPLRHDDEDKEVLGTRGPFDASGVAELLLDHPATASRLANRLIAEFFGDGVVNPESRAELQQQLRASKLDIGKAVATMLRSQLFFSDANVNSRVCDPLTFAIAPIRALELLDTPPSTLSLSDWLRRMGQDLFYPPNVAGWPGGRTWLTTRTVIARANYVSALVNGRVFRPTRIPNLSDLSAPNHSNAEFSSLMATLLVGRSAKPGDIDEFEDKNGDDADGAAHLSEEAKAVLRLLTSPAALLH